MKVRFRGHSRRSLHAARAAARAAREACAQACYYVHVQCKPPPDLTLACAAAAAASSPPAKCKLSQGQIVSKQEANKIEGWPPAMSLTDDEQSDDEQMMSRE